jgi:Tfp pilus assembly protein PilF
MADVLTLLDTLKIALARRDREAINNACRALIDAQAPIGGQWRAIALVLLENGEMQAARRAADLLVQSTRGIALARFNQAEIYARSGQAVEARAMLLALPADVPNPLGNAYMRGTLALNLGAMDDARMELRRAIMLAPQSGQSWLALAMIGRIPIEDGQQLSDLRPRMASAPIAERGPYFYALGKFLHEQGDYDGAFEAFAAGAAGEAATRRTDAVEPRAVQQVQQQWTAEALSALPAASRFEGRPIFVTGLPRSGSTLVEQILSAHSMVDGGEELSLMRYLVAEAGGTGIDPVRRLLESGRDASLIGLYEHLLAERFLGTGRVVDKTLLASGYMGLLVALFPEAPIIWMRRDPLDNAWSIFRTYFRSGLGWTFDLAQIGRQMRAEDALFAHWSALRPQQILPVHYADLVAHPNAVIPRIVAHCGLKLEPRQLRFHESERTVVTASVAQVRRPIHRDAVGAAAPYRRHLKPFLDAYQDPSRG